MFRVNSEKLPLSKPPGDLCRPVWRTSAGPLCEISPQFTAVHPIDLCLLYSRLIYIYTIIYVYIYSCANIYKPYWHWMLRSEYLRLRTSDKASPASHPYGCCRPWGQPGQVPACAKRMSGTLLMRTFYDIKWYTHIYKVYLTIYNLLTLVIPCLLITVFASVLHWFWCSLWEMGNSCF